MLLLLHGLRVVRVVRVVRVLVRSLLLRLVVVALRDPQVLDQADHKAVAVALRVRSDTTSSSLSTSKIC
jgi:hypothetical protein